MLPMTCACRLLKLQGIQHYLQRQEKHWKRSKLNPLQKQAKHWERSKMNPLLPAAAVMLKSSVLVAAAMMLHVYQQQLQLRLSFLVYWEHGMAQRWNLPRVPPACSPSPETATPSA